jgi:hypothetical protein
VYIDTVSGDIFWAVNDVIKSIAIMNNATIKQGNFYLTASMHNVGNSVTIINPDPPVQPQQVAQQIVPAQIQPQQVAQQIPINNLQIEEPHKRNFQDFISNINLVFSQTSMRESQLFGEGMIELITAKLKMDRAID